MPSINISDERKRDAVVKAESTHRREPIRYIGPSGKPVWSRRILKATVEQGYDALLDEFKDDEALAQALIAGDPDVDVERTGMFLWGLSRVYVNPKEELVYRIEQKEVVRNPDGSVRTRRPRRRLEPNVDGSIPLTWSGKTIPKAEAVRRYVFGSNLQIVHVNGLTFDFLFDMAKDLHERNALMIVGAGPKGRDPLVFRRGSTPYRGFLEGRVRDNGYILLLHLSNLELRAPEPIETEETA